MPQLGKGSPQTDHRINFPKPLDDRLTDYLRLNNMNLSQFLTTLVEIHLINKALSEKNALH